MIRDLGGPFRREPPARTLALLSAAPDARPMRPSKTNTSPPLVVCPSSQNQFGAKPATLRPQIPWARLDVLLRRSTPGWTGPRAIEAAHNPRLASARPRISSRTHRYGPGFPVATRPTTRVSPTAYSRTRKVVAAQLERSNSSPRRRSRGSAGLGGDRFEPRNAPLWRQFEFSPVIDAQHAFTLAYVTLSCCSWFIEVPAETGGRALAQQKRTHAKTAADQK